MILWRDSVRFGKNFSDGAILEVILLESRSKSSHLGRREGNKNSQIFILPLQVKKWHQLSNVKITDLICNVAQKICFTQRRTLLSCALKVQLGT